MLSRVPKMMLVAFDTNVYMGQDRDRLMILECLNCWVLATDPVRLLVPRVCLCLFLCLYFLS